LSHQFFRSIFNKGGSQSMVTTPSICDALHYFEESKGYALSNQRFSSSFGNGRVDRRHDLQHFRAYALAHSH
jgi:hypothetical protein